jgi:hypothetical protein
VQFGAAPQNTTIALDKPSGTCNSGSPRRRTGRAEGPRAIVARASLGGPAPERSPASGANGMSFTVRGGGGGKSDPFHMSHEQAAQHFAKAIAYVTKSAKAKEIYETLDRLPTEIPIYVLHCDGDDFYAHAHAGGGYIQWDPLNALEVTQGGWQSPAVALIHEMYHAYQEYVLKDIYPNMPKKLVSTGPGTMKAEVSKEEVDCVVVESNVVQQLQQLGHGNETVRASYYRCIGGRPVKSPSATGA